SSRSSKGSSKNKSNKMNSEKPVRRLSTAVMKDPSRKASPHIEHPLKMFHALQLSMKTGNIFNVNQPDQIRGTLNALENFDKSTNQGSLFDNKISQYCSPSEKVVYSCMVLTDLLMQKDLTLQHSAVSNDDTGKAQEDYSETRELAITKDINHVSNILLTTISKHKAHIQGSMLEINKRAYKALSTIKEIYNSDDDLQVDPGLDYEREFLKNINIILYMISKENPDNVNENFIEKIKLHLSTYLSTNTFSSDQENINFVKKDNTITKQQSEESFLKSFEEIVK
ncbi:MAG: hypothetical protein KAH32_06200, partial [Chlamydiia bacterium]|nr:hypothetical protein [Chlamydiia bacterium]